MDRSLPSFVSPLAGKCLSQNRRSTCPLSWSSRNVGVLPATVTTPRMQQTKSSPRKDREKKRAAPTFATDIKGNIVWSLRSGTIDDLDGVQELIQDALPRELTESILSDSSCCTVCETSVKGTKEGEGFHAVVMGVVLVDLSTAYRDIEKGMDGGVIKHGHLLTIAVNPDFPDNETDVKMLLGSLKKMKEDGVVDVVHYTSDQNRIGLLEQCYFKSKGSDEFDTPKFVCDLVMSNPEPKKKMM